MIKNFRIRSITAGIPFKNLAPTYWENLERFFNEAIDTFSKSNIEVQTQRIVLEPLDKNYLSDYSILFSILDTVARQVEKYGIRWVCLPIAIDQSWQQQSAPDLSVELLRRYPFLFLHFHLSKQETYSSKTFIQLAKIIQSISRLSNNGFDNFRVGVGSNILTNTPFFPFSLHLGEPAFSFAIESLGPLLKIANKLQKAEVPYKNFQRAVENCLIKLCRYVDDIGIKLEKNLPFQYKGIDASLAPFPSEDKSVAKLIEMIGPCRWGNLGTVTATSILTRTIKASLEKANARATGFNGVMYSPLEDKGLAQSLYEHPLLPEHFMLYATTCGCGIDMVPIAGDTLPEEIATLFQDVFTLSCIHNKPLGVRVLPIPNHHVNEITNFNHDFLVNTRIIQLYGSGITWHKSQLSRI